MNVRRAFAMGIILVFTLVISSCAHTNTIRATASTKQLQSALGEYLKKDAHLKRWKVLDTKLSLFSQQSSGKEVEAVFDVKRVYRLDYAEAEDAPPLKGRLAFMRDNRGRLSSKQRAKAQEDIEKWLHSLREYISSDRWVSAQIKAVGMVRSNSRLVPGSAKFYIQTEGPTDTGVVYVPLDLNNIPAPQQVEKGAYASIRDLVATVHN